MPDTLIGVVVVAAAFGPGYVFIRFQERRLPRRDRPTPLLIAELLVTGGLVSAFSALVVLLGGGALGLIELDELSRGLANYFRRSPHEVLVAGGVILALSHSGAWLLAKRMYPDPATISPDSNVWHDTVAAVRNAEELTRVRNSVVPAKEVAETGSVLVTAELEDGRLVVGYLAYFTLDPDKDFRELSLRRPLWAASRAGDGLSSLEVDYMVLPGDKIKYVTLRGASSLRS